MLSSSPRTPGSRSDNRARQAVLKVARTLRASDRSAAHGRCLGLSLELAHAAMAHRVDVELVVWSVVGDPNFLDHWAVGIGGGKVIDLTRLQVDAQSGMLHDIDDYPANFVRRRTYPAALLVPCHLASGAPADGRYDTRFAWQLRCRMFRHDLGRAAARCNAVIAAHSALSLVKFAGVRGLDRLRCALRARQATLSARLASR